ncbi:pancreatic triacylglycerol lipase [Amia ocellicauda]|uniref:pancreatic triacylglycerol lipase n=1 Tax=Amia ocellicauda TaxID=2972642 RepID=UPI003464AD21
MFRAWVAGVFFFGTVFSGEVCYDRIGCFSDDIPWAGSAERPIAKLPWSPDKIGTKFLLFTRKNPNNYQELTWNNVDTFLASNYKGNKTTRIITHGFIDKGDENWLLDMCKLMLKIEDINCICVDWKRGGRTLYTQSAQNIRIIGAQMADMIESFQSIYGQKPADFHVIGHSLGAHSAGEVGRRIKGLGRITGLDPAEPYFQGTPILVRLDPSDAVFVDVIHTDALPMIPYVGMGMAQAVGHLDFYPNGGEHMPGCDKNVISQIIDLDGIWEGTRDFVACNHLRSYKYYLDSILNPGGFSGYSCSNGEQFESGKCFPCPAGGCPPMGHHASKAYAPNGAEKLKFYLNTGDARPFGRWRYQVTITITGDRAVSGYIMVSIFGTKGNTRQYEIAKEILHPGKAYPAFIDTEVDVGEITHVKFLWNNVLINPLLPKFGAQSIVIQRGQDRKMFQFCGRGTVRENTLQTLNPCPAL